MTDIAELGLVVRSDGVVVATRRLDKLENQSKKTERATDKLKSGFTAMAAKAAVYAAAIAAITLALRGTIGRFAQFESGLIGVGKTTGITGEELKQLGDRLREISMEVPVTTASLLEIAEAAGSVGVSGSANVAKFTKTLGQLQVASDLAGGEAAQALARILTVTGTAVEEVDRLGAAIVALGNKYAATESEITMAATRVAQSTSQFGVSAAQVLGIATAMVSLGIEAEAGGTQVGLAFQAINSAVRNGGRELKILQEVTGQTGEALKEAFLGGQSAQVFRGFIEGLGRIQESGGNVNAVLDEIGLTGVRASAVLGTMAVRANLVAESIDTSNKAWKDNRALVEEATTASQSFESQLNFTKNAIDKAASELGEMIAPAALEGLHTVRDLALSVSNNIETITVAAGALALVITSRLLGALTRSTAGWIANTIEALRYQNTLRTMAGVSRTAAIRMTAMSTAGSALRGVMGLLGGPAGVIFLVVGALTAFIGMSKSARQEIEEQQSEVEKLTRKWKELGEAQRQHAIDLQQGIITGLQDQLREAQELLRETLTPTVTAGGLLVPSNASREEITAMQATIEGLTSKIQKAQEELQRLFMLQRGVTVLPEMVVTATTATGDGTNTGNTGTQTNQAMMDYQEYAQFLKDSGVDIESSANKTAGAWAKAWNDAFSKTKNAAGDSFSFVEQIAIQAARSMQTAMAGFFYNMDGDIKGMLKGFIDAVRRMIAEMLAFQTLKATLGQFDMFASFFAVPGKAVGGPVSAGKPYLVGEKGPELMVPNSSGTIIPNNKMGGSSITVNMPVDARGAMSPGQVKMMVDGAKQEIYYNLPRILNGYAPVGA